MAENYNKAIIDPDEAYKEADNMVNISGELEGLLKNISDEMAKINEQDEMMYFGAAGKAVELRDKVDEIRGEFHRVHEQVTKSSGDIKDIATKMKAE